MIKNSAMCMYTENIEPNTANKNKGRTMMGEGEQWTRGTVSPPDVGKNIAELLAR